MARVGPVVLSVAGDQFVESARVLAIIWESASASGDTASVIERSSGNLLWAGRTDLTQTYIGANYGPSGLHAPSGFRLAQISSGRVLVYLRED